MDSLIFISLFIIVLHVKAQANTCTNTNSCSPINCANASDLNIQFPFRLHEFQLHCKQNRTILHFPSYGDLVIKSISYDLKKLELIDPKNCVHEVFLNLNLSNTPFSYYYILKEYQYLNCSAEISSSLLQVPCLSGIGHHAYVVETSFVVPDYCNHVKTVGIPFSYSPFLSDNTFGLALTWHLTNSHEDSVATNFTTGHFKGLNGITNDTALGCIILFIFIVVMLLKLSQYSKRVEEKVNQKEPHVDAILGNYEALNKIVIKN
ncbi:putative RING-H2 finger protein ATL21A [Solanum dulcamara]|uniref:putative RING-H2 finger protein ATL21A n=1 Tax=Solanum dulcamara TaxID=45834 RepID=UPI002486C0A9|nr:putative RING-H2 finger protein ATL21A [Solanum dulcamara]